MKNKMLTACLACVIAACGTGGEGNHAAGGNEAAPAAKAAQARSIGDALAASADHSSLVQSLQAAALIETLRGAGPYTVFAPSNAAFAAIPEEARAGLAAPEQRDRLITLLSFHVVPGTVTAEDLRRAIDQAQGGRAELATVTGDNLGLTREGDAILLADAAGGRARITAADQIHANGVVHSIDSVLMPGSQ
ncbi:MAG TPA: fasciclin domain-containing protein [Allosphingosinicella sp.]|nr:fasciclin domain-containing protein [Allosphingosinicella sp.]